MDSVYQSQLDMPLKGGRFAQIGVINIFENLLKNMTFTYGFIAYFLEIGSYGFPFLAAFQPYEGRRTSSASEYDTRHFSVCIVVIC